LLGRDRLIQEMNVQPGRRILEVGCGTARNLIIMARRFPESTFFGLDASREMLRTAETNIKRAGLQDRISLRFCLAEKVNAADTFGLDELFDGVFFSYSLSMIPTWKQALQAALDNLKPGGEIAIVDFCDQKDLPAWFRKALTTWLSWFHVRHKPELLTYLSTLSAENGNLRIEYLYSRYSFFAILTKSPANPK
jgi:S-adenosylmethionine-diacylgycerolhomoserine-N-methlytransferase